MLVRESGLKSVICVYIKKQKKGETSKYKVSSQKEVMKISIEIMK